MLSTRAKREKIIEVVDKSVREKFPFGSNNRPEDLFDYEKFIKSHEVTSKFVKEYVEQDSRIPWNGLWNFSVTLENLMVAIVIFKPPGQWVN